MKNILLVALIFLLSSCGYHLRSGNKVAAHYPKLKLSISNQSVLKRPLVDALISSDVELVNESGVVNLTIIKNSLKKVIQSIGVNNQVQEYRLEYDVDYSIGDSKTHSIHLEKDYSFDIQQIGGGQQEELVLRKQLADDMAWAIIRQINASLNK
jgi:outer membrane lipopolysaccharide assembly protein LptE/RlpB